MEKEKDNWAIYLITIIAAILVCGLLIIVESTDFSNKQNDCEQVGGSYEVIGREMNTARNGYKNVYGCVR